MYELQFSHAFVGFFEWFLNGKPNSIGQAVLLDRRFSIPTNGGKRARRALNGLRDRSATQPEMESELLRTAFLAPIRDNQAGRRKQRKAPLDLVCTLNRLKTHELFEEFYLDLPPSPTIPMFVDANLAFDAVGPILGRIKEVEHQVRIKDRHLAIT